MSHRTKWAAGAILLLLSFGCQTWSGISPVPTGEHLNPSRKELATDPEGERLRKSAAEAEGTSHSSQGSGELKREEATGNVFSPLAGNKVNFWTPSHRVEMPVK